MATEAAMRVSGAVTPEEVLQFQEHGFVLLKNLLKPDQLARLKEAARQALESPAPQSRDAAFAERLDAGAKKTMRTDARPPAFQSAMRSPIAKRLTDEPKGHFLVDTCVWRRVQPLANFALHGDLPAAAAALLGAEGVRFYDDQLFIKEPGAADRTAFHQDLPYFNLDGDSGCVFWIPLDPVRRGAGAMGYVPGSHRWGDKFNPNIFLSRMTFAGSQGVDLPDIESDPEAFDVVYAEVDPGDVVVHHFLTAHGSDENTGAHIRRAFSLRYCDAAMRYRKRPGAPSPPLHQPGIKDGDVLDDAFHPQVWPKRKVEAV